MATAETTGARASAQSRALSDLTFDASTTRAAVIARWGQPLRYGPGGILQLYGLATNERVWLSFSDAEPSMLTRALLLTDSAAPQVRVLYDALAATKARQCSQIDFRKPTSAADVNAAWGPPDGVAGSGIDNWFYRLANGASAIVIYQNDRVVSVNGCPS